MVVRAETYFRLAFRASRRYATRSARVQAAYGLFRLALARGDAAAATQFALSAQLAYVADIPDTKPLLLDLARFWTDIGERARARTALRRLWPSLRSFSRPSLLATLALAAHARAEPDAHGRGASVLRAAWVLLSDEGIPQAVRATAALDLAYAAHHSGDPLGFEAAKRAVLLLTPQADFPAVSTEIQKMRGAQVGTAEPRPVNRSGDGS